MVIHIHLHLTEVLMRELAELQIDQDKAAEKPVVEDEILVIIGRQVEKRSIELGPFLADLISREGDWLLLAMDDPEAALMVCMQVIGNDAAVTVAGASGSFELNVAMPMMARNVLESTRLLAASSRVLAARCVDGITADADRMLRYAESSPSIVTPLNKYIGYEAAAKIAKQALAEGTTIRETVLALGYVDRAELTLEELDAALDVRSMTRP